MVFSYDGRNAHVGTTYADGSTVSIVRDAVGRVVSRTVTPSSGPVVSTTYMHAGGGDAAWGQQRGAGLARTFGLPGGVMSTVTGAGTELSYPSLLGHTLTAGTGPPRLRG